MKRLITLLMLLVFVPAAVRAQVVEYYHQDALGSVRAVTDSAGNVIARHDYLPFGEEWNPQAGTQPRRFTGKERDGETGLDYFGARYYGAGIARFTTTDPVYTWQETLADPQRWNRYAYAWNNPLRYTDPDGRLSTGVEPASVGLFKIVGATTAAGVSGAVLIGLAAYGGLRVYANEIQANADLKEQETLAGLENDRIAREKAAAEPQAQAGGAGALKGGGGRNLLQDIFSIKQQGGLGDIPAGTRAEAEALGQAWVSGPNIRRFELQDGGYGLTDGTRTFRLQYKPRHGVWKVNFQENVFVAGRQKGIEVKNIHMTITDMPPP